MVWLLFVFSGWIHLTLEYPWIYHCRLEAFTFSLLSFMWVPTYVFQESGSCSNKEIGLSGMSLKYSTFWYLRKIKVASLNFYLHVGTLFSLHLSYLSKKRRKKYGGMPARTQSCKHTLMHMHTTHTALQVYEAPKIQANLVGLLWTGWTGIRDLGWRMRSIEVLHFGN